MKKESMGRIEAIFFIHYQDIEKKIFVKLVMNNIGKCPLISVPVGEINNRLDMLPIHPLMMQISSLSPVSEKVAAHFMNGVTHRSFSPKLRRLSLLSLPQLRVRFALKVQFSKME